MDINDNQITPADQDIRCYLSSFSPLTRFFYLSLIGIVVFGLAMLPFCYVNVVTKVQGITRPMEERTSVRSPMSGIIAAIHYKDGMMVNAGDTLIIFQKDNIRQKKIQMKWLIRQVEELIGDLEILTATSLQPSQEILNRLQTSLYHSQYRHYLDQLQEKNLITEKLQKDITLFGPLAKDKVIAHNEFMDISFQHAQALSVLQSQISEQKSRWESELQLQKRQHIEYRSELQNAEVTEHPYAVRAPVSGTVMVQDVLYTGASVTASSEICIISPEKALLVECWLPPASLITLFPQQTVHYNLPEIRDQMITTLKGKVISIAKDYTLLDNKPMFRVKCSLDQSAVTLKNGFQYSLNKGLLLEARFLLARKSYWQLLVQQLYDWFHPDTFSQPADK